MHSHIFPHTLLVTYAACTCPQVCPSNMQSPILGVIVDLCENIKVSTDPPTYICMYIRRCVPVYFESVYIRYNS